MRATALLSVPEQSAHPDENRAVTANIREDWAACARMRRFAAIAAFRAPRAYERARLRARGTANFGNFRGGHSRHCEERSDEAIRLAGLDCFATLAMTNGEGS